MFNELMNEAVHASLDLEASPPDLSTSEDEG